MSYINEYLACKNCGNKNFNLMAIISPQLRYVCSNCGLSILEIQLYVGDEKDKSYDIVNFIVRSNEFAANEIKHNCGIKIIKEMGSK